MRARSSALSLVLALSCLAPTLAQEQEASASRLEGQVSRTAEAARGRTVLVVGVIGMGSGAVITPRGRVITNAHVVAGARYAMCRWAGGEQRLMRRLGIDYGQDLALLEPAEAVESPLPCFSWRGAPPPEGTWVLGLGFPGGYRGDDWAVASLGQITGSAANTTRVNGVFAYDGALRSDTPIFSGNSGGPLVDLEGRLIGLNGAADIQAASALTIPEARIKARLEELAAGWILLPTGMRLNPERTPVLNAFYRATDRLARQLPERVIGQALSQAEQGAETAGRTPLGPAGEASPGFAGLAKVAAASPRQQRLRQLLRGSARRPAIGPAEGRALTSIDERHAVTLGAGLRVGQRVTSGVRAWTVVARSEADDLALLQIEGAPLPRVELSPARPVGSLIQALEGERVIASGIVSSRARQVASGFLQHLRPGGGPLGGLVAGLRRVVDGLGIAPLKELLEQIDRAQELRDAFSGGTAPRSYAWVLSVDAPVAPGQLGGPVVDRLGRLVGVSVGIAHHGTTYVVPWTRIWRAFERQLQAPPTRRGPLRLY